MPCCILIAGMPASGKTTFAGHLSKKLNLPMVSKDKIKELLYDTVGFHSRGEKVTLSIAATHLLYYFAESQMKTGASFILENNFENVMKQELERLIDEYSYRAITVRFGGDVGVIYKRYLERDASTGRHGGHKTNDGWPAGQTGLLHAPLSMEEFVGGIKSRGIAEFRVGEMEIYVDATDYARVAYDDIITRVRGKMEEMTGAGADFGRK